MGTTTHRIALSEAAYTNISNGNLHCCVVVLTGQTIRFVIAETQPVVGTPDCIIVSGPDTSDIRASVFSVTDLEAADDLWARADKGSGEVSLTRGAAKVFL